MASNELYYAALPDRVEPEASPEDEAFFTAFVARLPANGRVLVIGCDGTGVLAAFAAKGHAVIGVEPSAKRRKLAQSTGFDVVDGTFENLRSLGLPPVTGIWCGRALRRVPRDRLARALANLAALLPAGAPVYLSVELGDDATWIRCGQEPDSPECLDQRYLMADLLDTLRQKSFTIISAAPCAPVTSRPGRWLAVIAERL